MDSDKNTQLTKLYEDALYWHYIGKGFTDERARAMARSKAKSLAVTNNK